MSADKDLSPKLKVLFVAYFFPPSDSTGVPGSMRTVKFVRTLSEVESHVLTTPEKVGPDRNALPHLTLPIRDEKLYRISGWDIFKMLLGLRARLKGQAKQQQSPTPAKATFSSGADTDVAERSALQKFKDFVYDLCYFPDQAGPWIIPATLRGLKVVRQQKIDAIFATGSPWSGLLVGYLVSRLSRVPLVVDFRDPWVNNPFHKSKGEFLDKLSHKLERRLVNHASAISLNTPPLLEEFAERYPSATSKLFVMPNGFDPKDFEGITPSERENPQDLVLCHAGLLYGVRDPAALLEAIRIANRQLDPSQGKVVFHQIGDVQLNYDINQRFEDLIQSGALVIDPPRPYRECLDQLASADILVNVQPGTKTQVPSKLYDYLGIGRPILNLTPDDGALGRIVQSEKLGYLFGFDDQEKLAEALVENLHSREYKSFSGYPNSSRFNINTISATLYDTLKSVCDSSDQH